jgi:hypothetical protein
MVQVCMYFNNNKVTCYTELLSHLLTLDNTLPFNKLPMPNTETLENNPRGIYSVDNKDREVSIIYLPGRQRQNNVERTHNAVFFKIRSLN